MKLHFLKLFLALFCSAFVLSACGGKSEADVAKGFYTSIASGKSDEAIAMLDLSSVSAQELSMANSKLKMIFDELKNQFDQMGGLKSVDVTNKTVASDGKTAEVTLTLTFGNGTTKTETMNLIKVGSDWKISMK
ncbi:DUF4878 domain-containing protein [Saezia sanguinis]|uniref:DUF4878 domain-containing protein n=1 Tax=Saezia sanguinis TaxID=1965230 RepID=UPI00306A479B